MSAVKTWRAPTAEDIAHGMAELGKIIGEAESVSPLWTRRLVLSEPDGAWCLLVDQAAAPSLPMLVPWADPVQLQAFPTAYPLAEGAAILQGPNNPEAILAERRARVKAHDEEQKAAAAKKLADEKAAKEAGERLAAAEAKLAAGEWWRSKELLEFALALASRVQERDYKLARDLRQMAEPGRRLYT
jgi:hypothetical protein